MSIYLYYDTATSTVAYRKGIVGVGPVAIAQLVNSWNIMVVQKDPIWSNVGEARVEEAMGLGSFAVRETRLRSPQQRLLIWDWFRIGGRDLVLAVPALLVE